MVHAVAAVLFCSFPSLFRSFSFLTPSLPPPHLFPLFRFLSFFLSFFLSIVTKTSVMLGLGETEDDVHHLLRALRENDVDVVTFGQYLKPSKHHLKVQSYVTPEKFDEWRVVAEEMGFLYVASGPLVRSSYRAGELFLKNAIKKRNNDATAAAL